MNEEKVLITEEGKLTDEGIEVLENAFDEVITDDTRLIKSLPSNNGVEEAIPIDNEEDKPTLESEEVMTVIDPNTGKITYTSEEELDYIGDIDEVVKMVDEDLTNFKITEENIVNALKEQFDKEFNSESIKVMVDLANRYNRKEKFSYYNALPEDIKKCINEILTNYGIATNKQVRNEFVRSTLQTIIYSSYIDQAVIDIDRTMAKSLNDIKDELESNYALYSAQQRDNLEKKTLEIAKQKEETEPEKAKLLRAISAAFTQSYTYEDMMNDYKSNPGKFKVKKIELEKFGNRLAMGFNNKYKNSKFTIRNVESLIPILNRWLPDIEEESIKKFIAIFIKYTINMKPEVLEEHVFMYYFINNIINLDYNGSDEDNIKFNMTIIDNIRNAIEEIQ